MWSGVWRSEEHTSELQSRRELVCRLLLEKKKPRGQRDHGQRGGGQGQEAGSGRPGRPADPVADAGDGGEELLPAFRRLHLVVFFLRIRPPPSSTLFPYTTLFR